MNVDELNLKELVAIGMSRGYRNPEAWAKTIIAARSLEIKVSQFTQVLGRFNRSTGPATTIPQLIDLGSLSPFLISNPEPGHAWTLQPRAAPQPCDCDECVADREAIKAKTNQPDQGEADEQSKDTPEPKTTVINNTVYVNGDYHPEAPADRDPEAPADRDPVALADALHLKDCLKRAEDRFCEVSRDLAAAHQTNATLRVRINFLEDLLSEITAVTVARHNSAGISPL